MAAKINGYTDVFAFFDGKIPLRADNVVLSGGEQQKRLRLKWIWLNSVQTGSIPEYCIRFVFGFFKSTFIL